MYCDVCIKAGPDIVGKAEFVTGKKKVYIWNFRKSCLSESRSFRPDYLFAPGRFAPLNHYYIIIDEVFFNNFLVIIYLLHVVVCKKNNNSFILVYFNYLFISCIQKKNNSFILVYFCQRSQAKLFLWITKNHTRTVKRLVFFVPTQKCMKWLRCCTSAQITSFLMTYASNVKIV